MTAIASPGPSAPVLARTTGLVAIASACSLAVFFAVGGPFGAINDVGNGLLGVLGGALAWRLRDRAPRAALAAAVAGGAVTVLGSWLIVSDRTGFVLAGLVSGVGFAGVGLWLWSLTGVDGSIREGRLRRIAAATMALGLVGLPAALDGVDSYDGAPPWVWVAGIGWLGTYVLFPAWALTVRPEAVVSAEARHLR